MPLTYFKAFTSYLDLIEPLNDAERGRLFTLLLKYTAGGEVGHISGNERFVWPAFKAQIDRDNQEYDNKCNKLKANASNCKQMQANEGKVKVKVKEEDKDNKEILSKESIKKSSRFSPPTLAEVEEYCRERGNKVDAQRFVDYYSSIGWKVGKNKNSMKDWKASVRVWEKSNKAQTSTQSDDGWNVIFDIANGGNYDT